MSYYAETVKYTQVFVKNTRELQKQSVMSVKGEKIVACL